MNIPIRPTYSQFKNATPISAAVLSYFLAMSLHRNVGPQIAATSGDPGIAGTGSLRWALALLFLLPTSGNFTAMVQIAPSQKCSHLN